MRILCTILVLLCSCSQALPVIQDAADTHALSFETNAPAHVIWNVHGLGVDVQAEGKLCVLRTPDDAPATERFCFDRIKGLAGGYRLQSNPWRLEWISCASARQFWPIKCEIQAARGAGVIELWRE